MTFVAEGDNLPGFSLGMRERRVDFTGEVDSVELD